MKLKSFKFIVNENKMEYSEELKDWKIVDQVEIEMSLERILSLINEFFIMGLYPSFKLTLNSPELIDFTQTKKDILNGGILPNFIGFENELIASEYFIPENTIKVVADTFKEEYKQLLSEIIEIK